MDGGPRPSDLVPNVLNPKYPRYRDTLPGGPIAQVSGDDAGNL
jgi:hypothetical protein